MKNSVLRYISGFIITSAFSCMLIFTSISPYLDYNNWLKIIRADENIESDYNNLNLVLNSLAEKYNSEIQIPEKKLKDYLESTRRAYVNNIKYSLEKKEQFLLPDASEFYNEIYSLTSNKNFSRSAADALLKQSSPFYGYELAVMLAVALKKIIIPVIISSVILMAFGIFISYFSFENKLNCLILLSQSIISSSLLGSILFFFIRYKIFNHPVESIFSIPFVREYANIFSQFLLTLSIILILTGATLLITSAIRIKRKPPDSNEHRPDTLIY